MENSKRKAKTLKSVTEKNENSAVASETAIKPAPCYKMIPVDQDTHTRLMALCRAYGFGQRGQGAMVRKLVNSEFEKIPPTLPASNL